jgi:type VI secretion system secreted protein Hcp
MPTHIAIKISGRHSGSKGGRLFAMAHGTMAITPRNLEQVLVQMRSESAMAGHSPAGKRQHKPLVITKEVDSASPLLLNAHWTGEVLKGVDIQITGPASAQARSPEQVYSTITLTNAEISSYTRNVPPLTPQQSAGSGKSLDTNELERFGFTFQKITYTNVSKKKGASDNWLAGP